MQTELQLLDPRIISSKFGNIALSIAGILVTDGHDRDCTQQSSDHHHPGSFHAWGKMWRDFHWHRNFHSLRRRLCDEATDIYWCKGV